MLSNYGACLHKDFSIVLHPKKNQMRIKNSNKPDLSSKFDSKDDVGFEPMYEYHRIVKKCVAQLIGSPSQKQLTATIF